MATDPFSAAFSGLWSVLNSSEAFAAAIPPSRQIRYDTNVRQPERSRGADAADLPADRPLVRIQPNSGADFLPSGISSSSTKLVKKYQLLLALGDLRVNAWMHPLQFIIVGALCNWETVLPSLIWQGRYANDQFIKVMRVSDVPEGKNVNDASRGIQTWASLFNLSLEMWFTSANLRALQPGDIDVGVYQ
jgi:hypothetical protein